MAWSLPGSKPGGPRRFILLILKAFASGCSALTGVEAIANAVPEFREPRARRAQHTEVWLGVLLGSMLIGLGILIKKFDVVPHSNITVLAQLTEASLGHNFIFYAIQLITMVLLALAANTSFGGLPVLASLLAKDNFLPHMFGLRADRQVYRYGVIVLAMLAAALLAASNGNTQALVPLVTLRSVHRSIARPIVKYLCQIEEEDKYHRLVVLIPEVQPPRFWDYLLFNQRGAILERAIRRGTVNVVLCRLRYRLEQFAPREAVPDATAPGQQHDSGVLALEDGGADGGRRADGRDGG